jgi:NADH-quinone oxidoreductase subunit E
MSAGLTDDLKARAAALAGRYPRKQAALLPLLHVVQEALGCVTPEAERDVAAILDIKPIQVREAVTFYTMFRRTPIGRYHLQVCDNLSCGLRGSGEVLARLARRLGIGPGQTTADGRFTLTTVECLGNCENAPCLMINFDYYGNVDPAGVDKLVDGLA